jgi:hypothetical protein
MATGVFVGRFRNRDVISRIDNDESGRFNREENDDIIDGQRMRMAGGGHCPNAKREEEEEESPLSESKRAMDSFKAASKARWNLRAARDLAARRSSSDGKLTPMDRFKAASARYRRAR